MKMLELMKKFPITVVDLFEQIQVEYESSLVDDNFFIYSIVGAENATINDNCLFIPYSESDDKIINLCSKNDVVVLTNHYIESVNCIIVSDIITVLRKICDWMMQNVSIPSIIITGSEGKTTTKRMIYRVMNEEYNTFCKLGNYNTLHALCCQIQEIQHDAQYIVQEVDESREKNIRFCSEILKPEIAVITNIAEAHIGRLGSKEVLKDVFLDIQYGLKDNGIIVLNGDDETSGEIDFDRKVIKVGIYNKNVDCFAYNIGFKDGKTEFDITYLEEKEHIVLNVIGEHNVYNAMVAFVVGKLKGISNENIKKALLKYRNNGYRQNICSLCKTTVYADCYNASLRSISFAVKTFESLKSKRKVLVIGDIAELGEFAEETYKEIADVINKTNIGALITYGNDSSMIHNYLTKPMIYIHATSFEDLNKSIIKMRLKGYNCWLFKASRIMKLENNIRVCFPFLWRLYING